MLTQDTLVVMMHTIKNLCVHQQRCIQACTPEIFATDAVMELVKNGTAFREAYKIIAQDPSSCNLDPIMNIKEKTHLGAPGNLGLSLAKNKLNDATTWLKKQRDRTCTELLKVHND